jgi:hypothetical protein
MKGEKCQVPNGERVERFVQSKSEIPLIQKTNRSGPTYRMEKYVNVNTYMAKE